MLMRSLESILATSGAEKRRSGPEFFSSRTGDYAANVAKGLTIIARVNSRQDSRTDEQTPGARMDAGKHGCQDSGRGHLGSERGELPGNPAQHSRNRRVT